MPEELNGPWLRHVDFKNILKKHKLSHAQAQLQQPTNIHQSGNSFLVCLSFFSVFLFISFHLVCVLCDSFSF